LMITDLEIVFAIKKIRERYGLTVNIVQPLREMPHGDEFYLAAPGDYLPGLIEPN